MQFDTGSRDVATPGVVVMGNQYSSSSPSLDDPYFRAVFKELLDPLNVNVLLATP